MSADVTPDLGSPGVSNVTETDQPINLTDRQLDDFAAELRRLASNVSRELRREQYLPALSDAVAFRPLLNLLVESLEARVLNDAPSDRRPHESHSTSAAYI